MTGSLCWVGVAVAEGTSSVAVKVSSGVGTGVVVDISVVFDVTNSGEVRPGSGDGNISVGAARVGAEGVNVLAGGSVGVSIASAGEVGNIATSGLNIVGGVIFVSDSRDGRPTIFANSADIAKIAATANTANKIICQLCEKWLRCFIFISSPRVVRPKWASICEQRNV